MTVAGSTRASGRGIARIGQAFHDVGERLSADDPPGTTI
jgi:hypothetical protein